jgi:hypothetical protein
MYITKLENILFAMSKYSEQEKLDKLEEMEGKLADKLTDYLSKSKQLDGKITDSKLIEKIRKKYGTIYSPNLTYEPTVYDEIIYYMIRIQRYCVLLGGNISYYDVMFQNFAKNLGIILNTKIYDGSDKSAKEVLSIIKKDNNEYDSYIRINIRGIKKNVFLHYEQISQSPTK